MTKEEKLYMVMDDRNNIYDIEDIPSVSPELEERARRNADRAYQEAKLRRKLESEQKRQAAM
ncbi:hypothetical protein [Eggerthella sinensis]|uniref:hypothetical protein n=1 Tax=Eggerthella sinensis TaxID=242230 RepID=UPI0022E2F6FE|nr:hypothetical protein [Eggerthella sinensis]